MWSLLKVYQVSLNDDPRLTFDLFYGKIKFVSLCICMGKLLEPPPPHPLYKKKQKKKTKKKKKKKKNNISQHVFRTLMAETYNVWSK